MLNDFPSQETHSPTPAAGGNGANGGKKDKGGLSGGAIAGIVIGVLCGGAIAVFGFMRYKKRGEYESMKD